MSVLANSGDGEDGGGDGRKYRLIHRVAHLGLQWYVKRRVDYNSRAGFPLPDLVSIPKSGTLTKLEEFNNHE